MTRSVLLGFQPLTSRPVDAVVGPTGGRGDGPGAGGSAPLRVPGQSSRSEPPGQSLPVMGSGLIEVEIRDRVGGGETEGGGLIEVKLALGRGG